MNTGHTHPQHAYYTHEKTCQDKLQARINDRRNNVSWKSQLKYENRDDKEENTAYIVARTHTISIAILTNEKKWWKENGEKREKYAQRS